MNVAHPQTNTLTDRTLIYSDFESIQTELVLRRNDKVLAKRLLDFWGENQPHFIQSDEQYAFFSRPVATPNIETLSFIDIASTFSLKPMILEFPDKFVSKNPEKRHLAQLLILKDSPQNIYEHKRIVDFNVWDGKLLTDVRSLDGTLLVDFHHKLFKCSVPHLADCVFDFSHWFRSVRSNDGDYYLKYLSLFIRNGVLFENFLVNETNENSFFIERIKPSLLRIQEIFGIKPLIHPILPLRGEHDHRWLAYTETSLRGDI